MNGSKARIVALAFIAETIFAGANGVAIRFSNREIALQRQERLSMPAVADILLGLAGIGLIYLSPGRCSIPVFSLLYLLARWF